MSELDFADLRERLEREADQPGFAVIRARRTRRTAGWAVTGAVVTLVVVLTGAVTAGTHVRHAPGPIGPAGTSSTGPSAPSAPATPTASVVASAFAPSGTMFVLAQRCPDGCAGGPNYVLLRGKDSEASWTQIGDLPGGMSGGTLLAANDTTLWLVDDVSIAASTDGGHSWRRWSVGGNSTGDRGYAGIAGDTVWIAQNGAVAVAKVDGQPATTPSQPPGDGHIHALAVLGRDRAAVLIGQAHATWYVTADRGSHWTAMADPCGATPYPRSPSTRMAAAPGGSLWVVCAAQPGAGNQGKQLVTSGDGGGTWQSRGALESGGYATVLTPFSATVAWRTGPAPADIYRTTDATHWSRVVVTGDTAGGDSSLFTALDGNTGMYAHEGVVYVTRDGGRTWQQHRLPAG